MSEPASISSGIAERYATAIFELALEEGDLDALEKGIDVLSAALAESADLNHMIRSPILTRDEQQRAILAVADALGLAPVLRNALGLMAEKRRLFVLPELVRQLRAMLDAHKGEMTAEVISARPLSEAQAEALAAALSEKAGRKVRLHATVDEALVGGLVVKLGSKMVDTSIRSRLNALKNAMKEVG